MSSADWLDDVPAWPRRCSVCARILDGPGVCPDCAAVNGRHPIAEGLCADHCDHCRHITVALEGRCLVCHTVRPLRGNA